MSITLGLHLMTAHAAHGYEAMTPGIYARHESGLTYGLYRNSLARPSAYAGWTFETEDKRFALTVGAVTGYDRRCERKKWENPDGSWSQADYCRGHGGALSPLLAPSVKVGDFRLAMVSFKRPAVHLAWERSL